MFQHSTRSCAYAPSSHGTPRSHGTQRPDGARRRGGTRHAGGTQRPRRKTRPFAVAMVAVVASACGGLTDLERGASNPSCQEITDIALGQTLGGELGQGDCAQDQGVYADRWRLTLDATQSVRVDLVSAYFDAYLEIRGESDAVLASNDDWGSLNSRIVRELGPGSYVIVARSFWPGQTGAYDLSVREGPDCSPLGTLALGEAVTGTLTSDDCLFEHGGIIDNWTLTTSTRQRLRMVVEGLEAGDLLVRDERGAGVEDIHWLSTPSYVRLEVDLPAGSWTVSPVSFDELSSESYELSVDLAPPCSPGTELVLGEAEQATIGSEDCLFDYWNSIADSFVVSLPDPTQVEIVAKSADFHPVVVVRDHRGHNLVVARDDESNGQASAEASLDAGAYAVYVLMDAYISSGDYSLTFSELACDDPTPVALGATVEEALGTGDCLRPNGARLDEWTLVLAEETHVRIDMKSASFDAYLILRDETGAVIQQNDDGGAGTDARIERTLAVGTYEIAASSFGPGQTGAYALEIAVAPAAGIDPSGT